MIIIKRYLSFIQIMKIRKSIQRVVTHIGVFWRNDNEILFVLRTLFNTQSLYIISKTKTKIFPIC